MLAVSRHIGIAIILSGVILAMAGCGGSAKAVVPVSYVLEPSKELPPGLETVAILPAERGPATDGKWSDMTVSVIQSLVQEANDKFQTSLRVADRAETKKVFTEADLAAAGMIESPGQLGASAKLLGVQAFILSKINVKVEKHRGKKRTIDALSMFGGGGRGRGHGGGSVDSTEVETVARNMTVQTEFKLTDAATGEIWVHWMPKTYRATEKTKASPFFGSSQTEAELTPRDQIIGTLVERGARDFVSLFLPCTVEHEIEVKSSGNEACVQGVKLMNGDMYTEALEQFRLALVEDPEDHRAAFAAGVACEATGRYKEALAYYRKACVFKAEPEYLAAKKRMTENIGRIRTEEAS